MTNDNLLRVLGQVSSSDASEVFRDFLRGSVRQMICEVMAAEVTELCGAKHRPSENEFVRAGSVPDTNGTAECFEERAPPRENWLPLARPGRRSITR